VWARPGGGSPPAGGLERTPALERWFAARIELEINEGAGVNALECEQRRQHVDKLVAVEGWVQEDDVPLDVMTAQPRSPTRADDLAVGGVEQIAISPQPAYDLRIGVDERDVARPARQCLETECPRAGIKVEHDCAFEPSGEPVEQRLAQAAERGPQRGAIGEAELSPLPLTPDNAQLIQMTWRSTASDS
jgi:hypothetical protein